MHLSKKKSLFISILRRDFDCEQLIIGGRGHVTLHMRGSTVHNQNKKQIFGKPDK